MSRLVALALCVSVVPSTAALAALWAVRPGSSSSSATVSAADRRSLTMDGSATVIAVPDTVTFRVQVGGDGKTREASATEAGLAASRLLTTLQQLGVAAADLRTEQPVQTPEYAQNRDGSPRYLEVLRWRTTTDVVVCIHDLATMPAIHRGIADAGAALLGTVSAETSRIDTFTTEARERAAAQARERAEGLARQLGARLGLPISVQTHVGSAAAEYGKGSAEHVGGIGVVSKDLALGKVAITATVNVVFELIEP